MSECDSVDHPTNAPPSTGVLAAGVPSPHVADKRPECPTCGGNTSSFSPPEYVYAIGRIEPRFPQLSIEKEFAQATARTETKDLADRQALHHVLREAENRYLARQLCWIMAIEGLETYILVPRDPVDFLLLIEALRPTPRPTDLDVVIGVKGPIAHPTLCNGLMVPIVAFDQIYSFDRSALIGAIPRQEGMDTERFQATAEETFDRITQMADNSGATDEHRALNYLLVRYPAVYATVAQEHARDASLKSVDVRTSILSVTRRIVEVIFSFTNRKTDVGEKFFVRVDVTEEFPFLVTKMSPYFDH